MAITRAQSTQKGHASLVAKDQDTLADNKTGKRPKAIQRRTSRLPKNLERDHPQVFAVGAIASPKGSAAGRRGTKRPSDAIGHDSDSPRKRPQKRPQRSSGLTLVEDSRLQANQPNIFLGIRRKLAKGIFRIEDREFTCTEEVSIKPREEKNAPYQDPRYITLLKTKASFIAKSNLDITRSSKTLCATLLKGENSVLEVSLFNNNIFESTYHKLKGRNKAQIIQDIARLIIPSIESLTTFRATHLDILTESLTKLLPFIGDFIGRDRSFFIAIYYIYFPFLTCKAVTKLFYTVKRKAK
ncbi:hypothetical protein A9K55_000535, partial [Cordyceps militaris]